MRKTQVKDLMVPLSRCPKTSPDASLLAAAVELEACGDAGACLVVQSAKGRIEGVFESIDYLKGLEPKYAQDSLFEGMEDAHYYGELARETVKSLGLFDAPMEHLCSLASGRKVGDFVKPLSRDQLIEASDSLDLAIHQLAMTGRQALIVTEGGEPAGVLKLTDVFKAVLQAAKTCPKP